MNNQHVVLVDDHAILLDGLKALLNANDPNLTIDIESSGIDFLNRSDLATVELVFMDINMKDKDGIQTYKEAKENGFKGKCIFLSSYDDLKLINEAINLGSSGYVTKSSVTNCIYEALQSAMNNEIYYSPDIRQKILQAFSKADSNNASSSTEKGLFRQLTEREVDVLKLIAQEYTSEEISKKLYIAKSTVDTHRKNLISKLKVKNAVGLGLFAERNGLI